MSASTPPAVSVRSVSKAYRRTTAVADATLGLRSGRITCLLGPSGCGKSTLLRLIAGLEPIDGGEIEVDGRLLSSTSRTVPPEKRGIGLVFQDFALFPHLTAAGNVAFGLDDRTARDRHARALDLLRTFKLEARAGAWPHSLSGGEQQRVAIARALARKPAAVLLDEPFSGLDGDLKAEVRRAVLEGLRRTGAATLIVTHDPEEALLMADDLALMHDGRILQTGTPRECYLQPVSLEAARLLGEVNVLPATIAGGIATTDFGDIPAPGRADGPATAFVRPEGLYLDAEGARARIVRTRFGGAFHELTLEANASVAILRVGGAPPEAAEVGISIDPGRAWVKRPA